MGFSRLLSLSMKPVGVEALDIRSRVRELLELMPSKSTVTDDVIGIVRFLVQAELLLRMSACEQVPYKALCVVDLSSMLDTKELITEKLLRVNPKDVRVCLTSPGHVFLTFKNAESCLLIGYTVDGSMIRPLQSPPFSAPLSPAFSDQRGIEHTA